MVTATPLPSRAVSRLLLVFAAASFGSQSGEETALAESRSRATAGQTETAGESSAERAVRALFGRLMEADNRGDVDAVVSCYAADAVLMPPDGTRVVGVKEIRRRYESLFAGSRLEVKMTVDGLEVDESLAFAWGETRGSIVPKDGTPSRGIADRYLMGLGREGERGEWRIVVLAWSPLPPGGRPLARGGRR